MADINTALLQEFIRGHITGPIGFILCFMLLIYIEKQLRLPERRNMSWWLKFDTRALLVSSLSYYAIVTGDFSYRYYVTKSPLSSKYFTLASSFTTLANKGMVIIIFFLRIYLVFENTSYQIPKWHMYMLFVVITVLFVVVEVFEVLLWRSYLVYTMRSVAVAVDFLSQLWLLLLLCSRLIKMNTARSTKRGVGSNENEYILLTVRFILMVSLYVIASFVVVAVSFRLDRWYGEVDVFFGLLSCLLIYKFPLTDRIYKILCCCHGIIERALELTVHLTEDINEIPKSLKSVSTGSEDIESDVQGKPTLDDQKTKL